MKPNNNSVKYYWVLSITISRLVFAIPILFLSKSFYSVVLTIWIGLSDFLDGYLARKWQVSSLTGEKLDQYIDKIVALLLLLHYLMEDQLSLLFVLLILIREIAILILRGLKILISSSNIIGKSKTFLLYTLFILLASNQYLPTYTSNLKNLLEYLIILLSYSSLLFAIKR